MLGDHTWHLKYTPDDGDLVTLFYVPALEDAERYDRLTGYFNARALTLAARGIEGLVRNGGRMRLVVGCTLEPPEIEAIERGEQLRQLVEQQMARVPLAPPDPAAADALELLAWMVARGLLEVKVAVPCDATHAPVPADGIFHEKTGIIEDRGGDIIAWTGSLSAGPGPAGRDRWHLSREDRHHRGPWRRHHRLDRQPQRDRCRLAAQLGEHQRLYELGPGTQAGRHRGGQLCAYLGQPGTARDRA